MSSALTLTASSFQRRRVDTSREVGCLGAVLMVSCQESRERRRYVRHAQLHSIWYSNLFSLFIQVVAFHPLYTLKLLDCH
jgi:hypothetical protein